MVSRRQRKIRAQRTSSTDVSAPSGAASQLAGQARSLWLANRFPEALEAFRSAVKAAPHDPSIVSDAARAFGSAYQHQQAESWLRNLVDAHPDEPDALTLAAQSYRMIGRSGAARPCLQRATTASPQHAIAWLELAVLEERANALAEARHAAEASLSADPQQAEAQVMLARLDRRSGDLESARRRLHDLIGPTDAPADASLSPSTSALAFAERARVEDQAGAYDDAWSAILASKRWVQSQRDPLEKVAQSENQRFDALAEAFGRLPKPPQPPRSPETARPITLLTGPPRTGTTLLSRILEAHPDVLCLDEQPILPRFIFPRITGPARHPDEAFEALSTVSATKRQALSDDYHRRVESWYGQPIGSRLHVDKLPGITGLIPALDALFPDSRIIYTLRDPRDVLLSCLIQPLPPNTISLQFAEPDTAADWMVQEWHRWTRLRDQLPKTRWIEVRYESITSDFDRQIGSLLAHLNLEPEPNLKDFHQRDGDDQPSNLVVQSPTYEAVSQPIHQRSIGRWEHYAKYLAPALDRMQPMLSSLGYV